MWMESVLGPVSGLQDPCPARAARVGDQGPGVRGLRSRRMRAGVMATLLERPLRPDWIRRKPPSSRRIRPSARRRSSTSCAPPSTAASTPPGTSTSTTPAASLYAAVAGRGARPRLLSDGVLRQPALRQLRPRRRRPRSSSRRALRCCATSTRPRASTRASSRRTPPARCGSSARPTRSSPAAVPRDVRQPQLGQRHPRVRPREGRA